MYVYIYVYIYIYTQNDSLIWIKVILGHLPLIIIIRRHFSWNRRNIYPDYPVPCHTTLLAMAPEFHAPFIRSTSSSNSGNRIPGCLLFSFATRLADGPAQQGGFIRDFCLEMGDTQKLILGLSYININYRDWAKMSIFFTIVCQLSGKWWWTMGFWGILFSDKPFWPLFLVHKEGL